MPVLSEEVESLLSDVRDPVYGLAMVRNLLADGVPAPDVLTVTEALFERFTEPGLQPGAVPSAG